MKRMPTDISRFLGLLLSYWIAVGLFAPCVAQEQATAAAGQNTPEEVSPIWFKENKGQWHDRVRYAADITGGKVILEKNRLAYIFLSGAGAQDPLADAPLEHGNVHHHPSDADELLQAYHQEAQTDPIGARVRYHRRMHHLPDQMSGHVLHADFVGANPDPVLFAGGSSSSYENYLLGDDPSQWAKHVFAFRTVTYQELYPGVDLNLSTGEHGLELDYLLQPGANPQDIQVQFEGAEDIYLQGEALVVETTVGKMMEAPPVAYQQNAAGEWEELPCRFVLNEATQTAGYTFPEGYDSTKTLLIDPPVLVFSTFTGATADNWGFTATYDNEANLYSGGLINDVAIGNQSYPVSPGAYQVNYAGGQATGGSLNYASDMALIKYDSTGSQRLWATYLGGSFNEAPHSLWADPQQNLYLMGTTRSNNFPTTAGSYDPTHNGNVDIVVSRLSADGTQLLASTYLGGPNNDGVNNIGNPLYNFYADDSRGEIILDDSGKVYVASSTNSPAFPITPGAYDNTFAGTQEGLVFRMDSTLSNLEWSTYLGGSAYDAAYSMKVDTAGNVYVVGGTESTDFLPSPGNWQPTYQGGTADGFVVRLNNSGTAALAATYAGTNAYDQVYFVELDEAGDVYITGQTAGNWPIEKVDYSNNNSGQFITKLNTNLDSVVYSTRFGSGSGQPDITLTAFLVDVCGNVYVSGWGGLNGAGNTTGMPTTPDAFQSTTDGADFYLIVFHQDIDSLFYATFFGSPGADEHVDGGTSRFDKNGVVYQSVCAACGAGNTFPTTPGSWSPTNGFPTNCNNAALKFQFDLLDAAQAEFDFNISSNQGCAPFTVDFTNNSLNGTGYEWFFGDSANTSSTDPDPTFVYSDPGIYDVKLRALNPGACNESDSVIKQIFVYAANIPDFTVQQQNCQLDVQLVNNTINGTTYFWDFGDGTTSTDFAPGHVYNQPGVYTIKLVVNPGTLCSDSIEQDIRVGLDPIIDISADTTFCSLSAQMVNNSQFAQDHLWEWGDGSPPATNAAPGHTYASPGNYLIHYTAIDTFNGCTAEDSLEVFVSDISSAGFSGGNPACTDSLFAIDTSFNVVSRSWELDGAPLGTDSILNGNFSAPGIYQLSLTINAGTPCEETITRPIRVGFTPVPDVQIDTAFCSLNISTQNQTSFAQEYEWAFGDGSSSQAPAPNHSYASAGDYSVVFTATDTFRNCSASDTLEIGVYDFASAGFLIDQENCTEEVTFIDTSFNGVSNRWSFGNGQQAQGQDSLTVQYAAAGSYPVTLRINEGTGCADSVTLPVEIPVIAEADFTIQSTLCDSIVFLTNTSPEAESFLWQFDTLGTSNLEDPSFEFFFSDTFEVTLVANPDSLCPDTLTQLFRGQYPTTANFELPDTSCDSLVALEDLSLNAFEIEWRIRRLGEQMPFTSFNTPDTLLLLPPGDTYIVTQYTLAGHSNCDDTLRDTVHIPQVLPPAFTYQPLERCSRTLQFSTPYGTTEELGWLFPGEALQLANAPSYTFAADDSFAVTLITNPTGFCPDTLTRMVFAGSNVVAGFQLPDSSCSTIVSPFNTSENALEYDWDFGDGSPGTNALMPEHTYTAPGTYPVTLVVDRGTLCEDSVRQEITVIEGPVAAFTWTQEVCSAELVFQNLSERGTRFEWQFSNTTTLTEEAPVYTHPNAEELSIRLVAEDLAGCRDTLDTLIAYDPENLAAVFVPNVFTPNGDELNDCWGIRQEVAPCVQQILIFDRWGNKIWHSNAPVGCWNGKNQRTGNIVPEGVYVYILKNESGQTRSGTVTVLR